MALYVFISCQKKNQYKITTRINETVGSIQFTYFILNLKQKFHHKSVKDNLN